MQIFCWCLLLPSFIFLIFYLSICVRQWFSSHTSAWPPNHCLFLSIFISPSPSLLLNSVSNHFNSPMQSFLLLSAPPLALPLPFHLAPPVSLIVLFSTEGYSCLQGYENVRKAHSIFSYVNSHFPPEQTHFPGSDLLRCTSHFPPPSLHYLSTIVGWGEMNSALSLLICHFHITDCCHCPLCSSPSCSPFKQPRLMRKKLSYINPYETAPTPVVVVLLTINACICCY